MKYREGKLPLRYYDYEGRLGQAGLTLLGAQLLLQSFNIQEEVMEGSSNNYFSYREGFFYLTSTLREKLKEKEEFFWVSFIEDGAIYGQVSIAEFFAALAALTGADIFADEVFSPPTGLLNSLGIKELYRAAVADIGLSELEVPFCEINLVNTIVAKITLMNIISQGAKQIFCTSYDHSNLISSCAGARGKRIFFVIDSLGEWELPRERRTAEKYPRKLAKLLASTISELGYTVVINSETRQSDSSSCHGFACADLISLYHHPELHAAMLGAIIDSKSSGSVCHSFVEFPTQMCLPFQVYRDVLLSDKRAQEFVMDTDGTVERFGELLKKYYNVDGSRNNYAPNLIKRLLLEDNSHSQADILHYEQGSIVDQMPFLQNNRVNKIVSEYLASNYPITGTYISSVLGGRMSSVFGSVIFYLKSMYFQRSQKEMFIPEGYQDVPHDGLCFYHAVVSELSKIQWCCQAADLYQMTINEVVEYPNRYMEFTRGGNIQQISISWANKVMIQAVANALEVNIAVTIFDSKGNTVGNIINAIIADRPQIEIGSINNRHFIAPVLRTVAEGSGVIP